MRICTTLTYLGRLSKILVFCERKTHFADGGSQTFVTSDVCDVDSLPPAAIIQIVPFLIMTLKPFNLYHGQSGGTTTTSVTNDPRFKVVVDSVNNLRHQMLSDETLRTPFLQIFQSVYSDASKFPEDLKPYTPVADQIPNIHKIRTIRDQPPVDKDVVDFLENAFPDIYLFAGELSPEGLKSEGWGQTISGRAEAGAEKIGILKDLVLHWLESVSDRLYASELLTSTHFR